jgi:hypothetical protein
MEWGMNTGAMMALYLCKWWLSQARQKQNEGQKKGTAFSACAWHLWYVCSFYVCSAYAQENVTGMLSRANFRPLTCPNADMAHPNRFCVSALTSTVQHLLEETGLTQGLWHIHFSSLYRCLTTGTAPHTGPCSQVHSWIWLITTHI